MAAGVNICGGADGLVGKVEGVLVVVVVKMSEEGGLGGEPVGGVITGACASRYGACEGVNHLGGG